MYYPFINSVQSSINHLHTSNETILFSMYNIVRRVGSVNVESPLESEIIYIVLDIPNYLIVNSYSTLDTQQKLSSRDEPDRDLNLTKLVDDN